MNDADVLDRVHATADTIDETDTMTAAAIATVREARQGDDVAEAEAETEDTDDKKTNIKLTNKSTKLKMTRVLS